MAPFCAKVLGENCLKCGRGGALSKIDVIKVLMWDLDENLLHLMEKSSGLLQTRAEPVLNPC